MVLYKRTTALPPKKAKEIGSFVDRATQLLPALLRL